MTLLYWVSRLEPLIRIESNQEVIVVFANRCGTEGEATYAGTSAVVGIQSGEIWVYGILGRGETGLLVVDTDSEPYARLAYQPLQSTIRSENDGVSDLEASVGNKPAAKEEPKNQDQQTPENLSKGDPPPTSQYDDDVRTWHVDTLDVDEKKKNSQSPRYSKDHVNHRSNKSQDVHTPRASSPKLNIDSLQLDIPSDQYMLRRYLESESPISHLDKFNSPAQPTTAPPEAFRGSRKDQDDYVAFYPDTTEEEKRFSFRSDVSVWNNQPGRVRQVSVSMVAPEDLSHLAAAQERPRTIEVGNRVGLDERTKSKSKAHGQRQSSDWNSHRGSDFGVPMSRQSSQNQLWRKYSQSQNDEIARSYSSSAVLPPHLLPSHTASQVTSQTTPDEVGRGRRRSSHKQLKDRRRGSRSTQLSQKEPIDLSQFTLIEEYPSASCPVHGTRPPSGTRHQNHSRARGRSGNRSQPLPDATAARKRSNHRSISRGEDQKDNNGLLYQHASSSKPEQDGLRTEKNGDRVQELEESAANPTSAGPRTPTAMLLIPDLELPDGLEKTFSLLKCVERAPEHIVRRRVSSIW